MLKIFAEFPYRGRFSSKTSGIYARGKFGLQGTLVSGFLQFPRRRPAP